MIEAPSKRTTCWNWPSRSLTHSGRARRRHRAPRRQAGKHFRDRTRQAKVLDFVGEAVGTTRARAAGPARSEQPTQANDRLTEIGSTVGTVAYMSPEQARGEDLDERSDLFSLGAVLYEMATGRPAFDGETAPIIYDAILNRRPVAVARVNPDVPPKLEEIIDKLLDKDRSLRYQTAADLETDLRRLKRDSDASRSATSAPSSPAPSPTSAAAAPMAAAEARKRTAIRLSGAAAVAAPLDSRCVSCRNHAGPDRARCHIGRRLVNTTGDPAFDGVLKQALAIQLNNHRI